MSQLKRVALMVFVTVESPEPDDPDMEFVAMKAVRTALGPQVNWTAPSNQRRYVVRVADVVSFGSGLVQMDVQPNAAIYERNGIEGTTP